MRRGVWSGFFAELRAAPVTVGETQTGQLNSTYRTIPHSTQIALLFIFLCIYHPLRLLQGLSERGSSVSPSCLDFDPMRWI